MYAGASEMESRLNAIWKMDHPMYRAYGNTMKTFDLAAKMAGCRGQSSYFVLRGLLSVPAELMARGPFISTDDLLKEVKGPILPGKAAASGIAGAHPLTHALSIIMQVQARMDDEHTRDVTSEMQLRCLFGKEMRAAFWRGQYWYLHCDHQKGHSSILVPD